MKSINWE